MYLGRRKLRLAGIAAVGALALVASGCGSSTSSGGGAGAKVKGGTVLVAEPPGAQPNYIWPFVPITNYSFYNSQGFQWLMYRPLYVFGDNGNSTSLNVALSPATAPSITGNTVVVNLKGWKWSDGETVNAADVMFWLNLESAEKANYAGYAPGTLPDNLTSYKATGPNQITMTTDKPYSSYWFTYNQLAEITPMPLAWDVTSLGAKAGSGGCATDTKADKFAKCVAVYKFMAAQVKNTSTYATSPIWGTVDGPWKLTSFSTAGNDTFVPNPKYSGSPKPQISTLKLVPYTSDATEYTALKTNQIQVGYVPPADLPLKPAGAALPATNPLGSNFTLAPFYAFGIYYMQPNFSGPLRAVFKQLYARAALQETFDQPGIDKAIYRGYSVPTSGGVPTVPPNQWTPPIEKTNAGQGPYPFNISAAKALLTSHGWSEVGGVMTCQTPAKCGAGIAKGTPFKFTLQYSTGTASAAQEFDTYKSDASKAGISINLVGQTFNAIIGQATPCKPGPKCKWDMLAYGGWIFNGPGFEPTGEPLFQTGAGSNSGSYSNAKEDQLINATHTSSSLQVFQQYATYTAQQLPYIWNPNPYAVQAVSNKLHGVTFNSLGTFTPEYWFLTK